MVWNGGVWCDVVITMTALVVIAVIVGVWCPGRAPPGKDLDNEAEVAADDWRVTGEGRGEIGVTWCMVGVTERLGLLGIAYPLADLALY
jgi:hypothetical protein